ncbi:2-amino-4-hydroxy-6-hydroxymethyldihydropteridine diphosphokinase [Roseovarius indicus]|uniref:2-amino-4-hydroxy-6-hydroxymethyldihydropteridine pyrophosphokinase n=2 Tax=Roseovarius indicus TaxID=540747 RepID=A0A5P3A621_9RHOB|nr:2-amino-4-hydroxy-6-hydroxymethyldihydropteridine diphosphokinase [Roseovarius indicus]QEW24739.1 2-amino-4-hydroxy-6- hydroxymethyldihydropteridine pyrophosphokinase [Roseovarius indicus]SFE76652.1 2-amino-4-hydroxy-6-hydroxymethyldihydropteridinediphosphokinase [Roseovarius indicus]
MVKHQFFLIALGANMPSAAGSPDVTSRSALRKLSAAGAREVISSRFFATPCFPPGAGPDYVNAAAGLTFDGGPEDLLAVLHGIEADFGRERVQRWGQRVLDLDLIAAGEAVLPDAETYRAWLDLPLDEQTQRAPDRLILPHPRMQDRAFVLVPLAEVAPEWRHPVLGKTVAEMVEALPQEARDEVVPL